MTWNDVAANWTAFSPAILQRWTALDQEGLSRVDGRYDALVTTIAASHDLSPAEAERQLATWLQGAVPTDVIMSEEHDNASISASANALPDGETPLDDDSAFGDDHVPDTPMGRS